MQVFFDDEMFHREYRGGVSRYLCELGPALAASGAASVVMFGGWSRSHTLRALKPTAALRVHHLPRDLRWSIGTLAWRLSTPWRRWTFVRALRRDPDTVYHPGLYAPDPWIVKRAPALVCTLHDMQVEIEGRDGTHARRQVRLKQALGAAATRIICVSESTRRDVDRLIPVAAGKTRVVYINSNLVAATPEPGGAPYFLFVGNRHGYKNGRRVLASFYEVARDHPTLRLRLCGGRPPGDGGEYEGLDAAFLASRIDWSRPDDEGLARAYAGALGLLYPSDYEGFGLPVLEAMRCGCPVVTTRVSSLPEVGGEAVRYLEPGALDALTGEMRRLLGDPVERDRLREAGLVQARRFSWEATARGVAAVMHESLAALRSR